MAKGIEEASDEAILKEMRCQYGQGYFYSKPMPSAALALYLTQERARLAAATGRGEIRLMNS